LSCLSNVTAGPDQILIDRSNRDHWGAGRGQPASGRGVWDSSLSCLSNVAAGPDQIAQAVIVPASFANRGIHDSIIKAAGAILKAFTVSP